MDMASGRPETQSHGQSTIERYLAAVDAAQSHHLDAVTDARRLLAADSAQLAEMSALQLRLTRRFFDAQRAILRQRAQADESLQRLVPGLAFIAPSRLDHGRFERQLGALLDEWWRAEQHSCAGVIDATPAVPADTVQSAASMQTPSLPPALVDVLDAVEVAELDRLLDDLVADFTAQAAVASAAATPTAKDLHPSRGDLAIIGADDDGFDRFWVDAPTAPAAVEGNAVPTWRHIASHVVLPIVGVTAGLSLVMALVG